MKLMNVTLPAPSSSVVDVLAVLELANEPTKLKKIIKELHEASKAYLSEKEAYDDKVAGLEKHNNENEKKILKLNEAKELADKAKASLSEVSKGLEAKKIEVKKLEDELAAKIKNFENEKSANASAIELKIKEVEKRELKALELKDASEKLSLEYKEKIEKLKALTA